MWSRRLGSTYGSFNGCPFTYKKPLTSETVSPGRPISRLTKVPPTPHASFGAWKTTICPRSGSPKRYASRFAITRSLNVPVQFGAGRAQWSVVSIDAEGTRIGLATSASKTSTNATAAAIVSAHSTTFRIARQGTDLRAARRARRAAGPCDHPLHGLAERARHLAVAAVEAAVGGLGLAAAGSEAGHAFEVGHERDRPLPPRGAEDRLVCDPLGLGGRRPARRVPVVHDDVRDRAEVADLREERDVPLAGAVDDRDRLLVDVVSERAEHEGEHELLGSSFHEQHGAREEDLRPLRVELGQEAERLLARQPVGLQERRPGALVMADEHELLEPVDGQEDRGVGRVEDLVAAAGGEPPQQAVQVPLRRRAQEELRLLDQDHEPACPRLHERGDRTDERQPAVVGLLPAHDACGFAGGLLGDGEQRGRPQVRREEQRGRRSLAVQVERRRRPRVEEERAVADHRLDTDAAVAARDVRRGRHRRGRLQQGPDRGEHRRLAGRRLADEDAELAGRERDVARAAEAVDRDALDQRRNVFFNRNSRFAGRSPRRRIRYGYQSGPYGVATRTLNPRRRRSSCSCGRTPYSVWNSNVPRGTACSFAYRIACSISFASCVASAA